MKPRRSVDHAPSDDRPESPRTPGSPFHDPAAWVVVVAALTYYAAFIWRSSFVVDGTRYFALFDDAMISMRYGRNLLRGHGLVWNVGEPPIEGFSNPLWTGVMGVAHLVPLPSQTISLVIQGLGAAILAALTLSVRSVCRGLTTATSSSPGQGVADRRGRASEAAGFTPTLSLVAMILVAFYYPLVYWTLQGMEVGLLALCTSTATAMFLTRRGLVRPYLVLAAGIFTRMDFALVASLLAAGFALLDRPRAIRHLAAGLATVLVSLGVQTAARYVYFHDLLPNTYYLKLTGFPLGLRLRRGATMLIETLMVSRGLLVLLPLAGLWLARGQARRDLFVLAAPFLAFCAYSVWVGGDAWEGMIPCNRYLSVGVPLLLVAAARPLATLASRLGGTRWIGQGVAVALALAAVLTVAPYQPTVMLVAPAYREVNAENTARAIAAAGLTGAGGSVAAAAVGAIGYYTDRRMIDLLGKNDRYIARLPARLPSAPATFFVPGHMKFDYGYSIGALRPDVVAQLWWNPREADPYLAREYVPVRAVLEARTLDMAVRRPKGDGAGPTAPRRGSMR